MACPADRLRTIFQVGPARTGMLSRRSRTHVSLASHQRWAVAEMERRFDANIASTLDMADDSLPPLVLGNKVAVATHAESYGSL
jgi:hypothetical protein